MSTRLTDLLIIEIKSTIVYAFSKEDLKLYRLNKPNDFEIEIGTFISCDIDNIENETYNCSNITKRSAVEDDCVRIKNSETGPLLVMKSYMIYSKNTSLWSNKMNVGFSDWYGYISTPLSSFRKFRDCVYIMEIVVDDLDYEKTTGACLFRQFSEWVGKKNNSDYLKQAELREIDLKNRNSLIRDQKVDSNSRKSKSPTTEKSMSKKAAEYKVLVLRYDLERKLLYGFNKDERCLMTIQLEYGNKIRVGSSVTFIVCSMKNGVYTPEIGSVNIDDSDEVDILNYLGDNVEIRTKISFSNVPSHFTFYKKVAFSDSFGFVDVGNFDLNFQPNYIYDTVIRIKQCRDTSLPCFEAIKSPTITNNFLHEKQFLQNMLEFEAKRVESRRENFGANGFTSQPREPRESTHNPYYTKNNKGHAWIKAEIKHEYQRMLVINLYDKPIDRSYGLVSTQYGDADLFVVCDDAGEHHLKTGVWFKGVLDKKKNSNRLVVEKVETIIASQDEARVTDNKFFITTSLDLLNEKPKDEEYTVVPHGVYRNFVIERDFYDLFGKRVVVELMFIPRSQESWVVHKLIFELPDNMSYTTYLQNRGQGNQNRKENSNSPAPTFVAGTLDDTESDDGALFINTDDDEDDKPAPSQKPKNNTNKYPTSNEPRGYKKNYKPAQDDCDNWSNGSYRSNPPPNRNHSTSRAGNDYPQSNSNGYANENHSTSRAGNGYQQSKEYSNEKSEPRSNGEVSSEKKHFNTRLQDDYEDGYVTQRLVDEVNAFIVYSNVNKRSVLYRLIPGSTNARLGEYILFRSRRINNASGHYNYEVTEVIEICSGELPNPIKIVGNYAQVATLFQLHKFQADLAAYGIFVVHSKDIGDVVYGEDIDTPLSKNLNSFQFHEMYRQSTREMVCFCQFEYGVSNRGDSYEYRWVLKSCEGTFNAWFERERSTENRNIGNHEQYREEDDIAQAKRRNAENARNPSYMQSNYSSRAPTSMSEQSFRNPPQDNFQQNRYTPEKQQNYSSRQDDRKYDNDFRSAQGSSSYQRNSPNNAEQHNGYSSRQNDRNHGFEEFSKSARDSSSYQRSSPDNTNQQNGYSSRQDDRKYDQDFRSAQGSSSYQRSSPENTNQQNRGSSRQDDRNNRFEEDRSAQGSSSYMNGGSDYPNQKHEPAPSSSGSQEDESNNNIALRNLYKVSKMLMDSKIRQVVKQYDHSLFEEWERTVKEAKDALASKK